MKGNFTEFYLGFSAASSKAQARKACDEAAASLSDAFQKWRVSSGVRIPLDCDLSQDTLAWGDLINQLDLPQSPLLIPFHWPENTKTLIASWQQLIKIFPSTAEADFALQMLSDAGDQLQHNRQAWADEIFRCLKDALYVVANNFQAKKTTQLEQQQLADAWLKAAERLLEQRQSQAEFVAIRTDAEQAEQAFPMSWRQIQRFLIRFAGLASSIDLEQVMQQQQAIERNQQQILEQNQQQMQKMHGIEAKLDKLLQQQTETAS
ncbi:hypothetical protein [Pelagibaculum spongiae]|uniref:hypothetical protein n=1 Tax=Pelagibaculum spongiae TaxID=2080658 RepID=UPI001057AB7D|nr:hypothetical protein [Pelagibaculum spongiae]